MATIKPGRYDPTKPDIELFDYKSKKRFGLKLEGSSALQIGTISQDDTVHIRSTGKRVGDFDEQRSWKGGRGIENLSDNAEAFWDSQNAWTMTAGHVHQTLLWQFSKGLRSADFFMPDRTHSVSWMQLFGASRYIKTTFSSSGFTANYARMWIRRVGTPGPLTLFFENASVGQSMDVSVTDVTDFVSVLHKFQLVNQAVAASSSVVLGVYGDSADNKNNHWEVGGYSGGTVGTMSSDGMTYVDADFDPYYYLADADVSRKWFTFFLDKALYVVDRKDDDTTASQLYINGDRGEASSGQSDGITDSSKSWTVDQWAGAWVKIVRGVGKGQAYEILSNTATKLVVAGWVKQPDTTSEYVIYATDWFTELTSTGLGVVESKPMVCSQIVYFPQGSGDNIRRMIWNPTTNAHAFSDDGTNKATFLIANTDQDSVRIWKGLNGSGSGGQKSIAYATSVEWSATPTDLTFTAARGIGDSTYEITGMLSKESLVYVMKEEGVWIADVNVKTTKLQSGLEKTPGEENGVGCIAHGKFLYYSWGHSLIRVYGSSHDDIGQDWSGWGLPDGREGVFGSLDSYTSLLLVGVDAGSAGTSSVLGFDGIGWHEILRAYDAGLRIRMVKVQPCYKTRNRTWIDVGGTLIFQEMPYLKGSPRLDSGCRYMHEAVLESATIDMGTASALPKFIKELVVSCRNLGDSNRIEVDYQVDDDVHTNNWTNATTLYESPEATAFLGINNIRKFAYRLRILSSDNTEPVDIEGVVPNGHARVPYKMVWTLRCRADNVTSRGRLVKPDILMRWLLDNARYPGRVEMRSQYQLAHQFFVIIHPPRMFPYKPAQNGQAEESVFTIVLEES